MKKDAKEFLQKVWRFGSLPLLVPKLSVISRLDDPLLRMLLIYSTYKNQNITSSIPDLWSHAPKLLLNEMNYMAFIYVGAHQ